MGNTLQKKWKLCLVVVFTVIMLISSLETIRVNATINDKDYVLPDFLIRLSEYISKGNATELERIQNQMITQEKIKQDRIESTNGAVLHSSASKNTLLDWPPVYSCLSTIEYTSPDTSYGYIEYEDEMIGSYDDSFAHLHTDDWNYHYDETAEGGEAFAGGYTYGGWASGDFYVQAKRGSHWQSGWQNYVILYTSDYIDTPFGSWNYIGYAQVTASSSTEYYVGTSYIQWNCLSVMCWTPPPYPNYYSPLIRNCVLVDSISTENIY
jgi:hypothetical protein